MNLEAQMAQHMHAQQQVQSFISSTAVQIYAQLVGAATLRGENITPDLLRAMARNALTAAPFMAEALKMVTVNEKEDGKPIVE